MAQNPSKIIKMSVFSKYLTITALFFCLSSTVCFSQQQGEQKPMSQEDMIAKQVEDMVDRYKLDDYQAFRIDTLLQHFGPIYNQEIQKARAAGASQYQSYQRIVDFWGDFFDKNYQEIFTEEQWKLYLKSQAGREKKKRDKRLAAAKEGAQ
jgi:hypothetical protein